MTGPTSSTSKTKVHTPAQLQSTPVLDSGALAKAR